jgi:hypothetical protein
MATIASCVNGIEIDPTDISKRPDLTESKWIDGVNRTLRCLWEIAPCCSSRAVLLAIQNSGKRVTIIPPSDRPLFPDKSDAHLSANPAPGEDDDAADVGTAVTKTGNLGSGKGANVIVEFAFEDCAPPDRNAPLTAADDSLIHELTHAMRMAIGRDDEKWSTNPALPFMVRKDQSGKPCGPLEIGMSTCEPAKPTHQFYTNFEEFVAIVITNIYRSENQRPGLRRDHVGLAELGYPLTNARVFMDLWKPQLDHMWTRMTLVCFQLAEVKCHYNPIRELFLAKISRSSQAAAYAH